MTEGVLELHCGMAGLRIDPSAGGRVSSLTIDGLELVAHDGPLPVSWGWYPMVPWAGRLTGNALVHDGVTYPFPPTHETWAIHGTVYDVPWTVDRVESTPAGGGAPASMTAVLSVPLGPPWPWPGLVRAAWTLTDRELTTVLEVHTSGDAFPAVAGWHPWFRRRLDRGEPAQLDLPATQMLVRAPDHLPTGELTRPVPPGPYDDTFPLPGGRVGLRWPGALSLECVTDCPYVVVYDEPADALCVEPQTAPPDGINRWVTLVRPGEPLVARATWSWHLAGSRSLD